MFSRYLKVLIQFDASCYGMNNELILLFLTFILFQVRA